MVEQGLRRITESNSITLLRNFAHKRKYPDNLLLCGSTNGHRSIRLLNDWTYHTPQHKQRHTTR